MDTMKKITLLLGFSAPKSWSKPTNWQIIQLLLLSCGAFYNSHLLAADLHGQRGAFQQALQAQAREDWESVRYYANALAGYPLSSYLHYRYLQAKLPERPPTEIKAFIQQHQHNFMGKELNYAWLHHLVRNEDWQALEQSRIPASSQRLRCYQLAGRLVQTTELNATQEADLLNLSKDLWLVGKSQHKACDPVFAYLDEQGLLSDDLIWQRLILSIEAGKTGLASYLGKKLSDDDRQRWAAHWQRLPSDPHSVLKKISRKRIPVYVDAQRMISYGIQRLARKNADKAAGHWQHFQTKIHFSPEQKQSTAAKIAVHSALQERPSALDRLQKLDSAAHNKSSAQLLLQMLLEKADWRALSKAIQGLSQSAQQRPKFRYWLARSFAAQGQNKQAQSLFERLAKERDFYGFLAAERLNLPYTLNHKATHFNPSVERELYRLAPDLEMAREFYHFDLLKAAKLSWESGLSQLNQSQKLQASALARSWNWYDQGIITAAKAKSYNDLEVRFPLAHYELIAKAAQDQQVDAAWVYGIIRRESAFMRTVTSRVGARGLMQLMPGTQALMAKKIGLDIKDKEIFDSYTNIRLGTAYLKHLLDKFAGSYLLATAGYNAGPGRAQRWWKARPNISVDRWVELIPYKETRRYVKQVMIYTAIYERQLGRKISPLRLNFPAPKLQATPELAHSKTTN